LCAIAGRKLLEVANSVGYDSDAAFNRAFKRMHGVSAGEYSANDRSDLVSSNSTGVPGAVPLVIAR